MDVETCEACSTRVMFRANGECPSCHHIRGQPTSPPQSANAVTVPETAKGAPKSRMNWGAVLGAGVAGPLVTRYLHNHNVPKATTAVVVVGVLLATAALVVALAIRRRSTRQ